MLSNLKIENIAIIESASIDFREHFNCMTGETGAGKSIIIDSINAVTGEKTSRELIRTGEKSATVSALFTDISESAKNLLASLALPCETDSSLLITRIMTKDGRNVCRVNGAPATVSMLKRVGSVLINIHGQADNQKLMSPELHYTYIDAVAENGDVLSRYRDAYAELMDLNSEIKRLTVDDAAKARQIDLLKYQTDELRKADIRVGEREELTAKRRAANNSQKLVSALNEAYAALAGGDDFQGAVSMLFDAGRALSQAAEYLPEASETAETVNDMAYTAEALIADINSLAENSVFDERELADIEERLDVIYRMSKKYGETEEEMLLFLDNAEKELHNITYSDELLAQLNQKKKECEKKTYALAEELTATRKKAAEAFSEKIQNELSFLDMPGTKFSVSIKETPLGENGRDDIEFLISANKGEEPKPLAKIASGGELSRIMLAIKSVLADKDDTDTLIFDEIDSGVSGRAAGKIALKLYEVSLHRQVICITHLPSIAAFADHHMLISKEVRNEKTYTTVTPLDIKGRTAEIARIIGGSAEEEAHLESAALLLSDAAEYKKTER